MERTGEAAAEEFLEAAAEVPGIYVPSFYEVAYQEDGTTLSFHSEPTLTHPEKIVKKQVVNPDDAHLSLKSRWCPLSRLPRTGWFWRSREAASGAAVSARPGMFTALLREHSRGLSERLRIQNAEKYRARRDFPEFLKFQ